MAKPRLREPFATLCSGIIETIIAGHKQWRPDLPYPESYSDMKAGVMALLQKYEIKLRDVPLDSKDLLSPPPVCPICRESMEGVSSVASLKHPDPDGGELYAHPECVNWNARKSGGTP